MKDNLTWTPNKDTSEDGRTNPKFKSLIPVRSLSLAPSCPCYAVPDWKYPLGVNDCFTCHFIQKGKFFPFDDAIQFLDQCQKDKGRVLVFCMTGNSRSAAIVIAYLMKCKGWTLGQSYQWVKERRASIDLSPDVNQQLKEYEQKIFGSVGSSCPMNDDVKGLVFTENDDADYVGALGKLNIESNSDNAARLRTFSNTYSRMQE
ncbi:Protein-tyrosine-phosphatase ibr5 [Thalictrum thalictroides]|uniref:Protein-tyrosine-phosphatase ibr5 n=1 Tax=Thalictrum thalictroides TaxID=46969 RepID=A0A7J6VXP9_THATH|nr:Protein-tyrosine-phosphatase ibr5 [Thalictrum thalictroides]